MNTYFSRLALALVFGALVLSACGGPYQFKTGTVDNPTQAPDFTLTSANGDPFQLGAQRGKVTTIFFGFTHCPDICPTALADMRDVRRELGAAADNLRVVFITVDPARDTPQITQKYVEKFDPSFIGLSATQAQLDPILKSYGVTATRRDLPDSALKYTMDHSAYTYVIDKQGRWRLVFAVGMDQKDIASDLRYLLQEQA